ncbi:PepSY-associated TM helix domain-containing protein [Nitrospira sp. M1]
MSAWFTNRQLFSIHGWLGLNLGILLFAICLSGTIAVFTPELDWWLDPIRQVSPPADVAERPISWDKLYEAVKTTHPHAMVARVFAPPDPNSAAAAVVQYPPRDTRVVFLNPYTHEVTGQRTFLDIKSFIRIFHKQLYLVPDTIGVHGTFLVGMFSLITLGAAITGLCVFKHWWRAFYTIRLGRGWRIMWSDMHRCCGVWSLLVAMLLSMTGVWYLTELVLAGAGVLNREVALASVRDEAANAHSVVLRPLPLDEIVQRVETAYPELTIDTISLPTHPQHIVTVYGQGEASVVRSQANSVSLDPYTGEILDLQRGIELSLGERLMHTADPLHFGTFGGTATKVLWFASGLVLTIGILSGSTIHWVRVTRTENHYGRRRYRWMISGIATTMVLIASAWSAVAFITGGQVSAGLQRITPIPAGSLTFQDWRGTVYREGEPQAGTQTISIHFDSELHFNIQNAFYEYGRDAEVHADSLQVLSDRVRGQVTLPKGQRFIPEPFHLRLIAKDGMEHVLKIGAIDLQQEGAVMVPPRPEVPMAVYWSIAGFCVMLLVPSALWLRYMRW